MTPRDPCQELRDVLAQARDDAAVAEIVAAHVATCPHCSATERLLEELLARYRAEPLPGLDEQLEARLLDLLCRSPE